jgi:hypothetical protein
MPPSGYNLKQCKYVNNFLISCADALKKEGIEKSLSPTEALVGECNNIKTILFSEKNKPFANAVLNLTFSFYSELLNHKPKSYDDFQSLVANGLKKVKDEILDVHVPEI